MDFHPLRLNYFASPAGEVKIFITQRWSENDET